MSKLILFEFFFILLHAAEADSTLDPFPHFHFRKSLLTEDHGGWSRNLSPALRQVLVSLRSWFQSGPGFSQVLVLVRSLFQSGPDLSQVPVLVRSLSQSGPGLCPWDYSWSHLDFVVLQTVFKCGLFSVD